MNSRENFLQMLEGGRPQWIPFDLPTTEPVAKAIARETGLSPEEAFDTDFQNLTATMRDDDPATWRAAIESTGFRFPERSVVGAYGISWVRPPVETLGVAVHLLEMLHPLADIDDLESLKSLPWPDTSDPANYTDLARQCAAIHSAGKVASGANECTIFEHTWYLRGMDNVFCDWAEENPITEWLLDYFTERSVNTCRALAKSGCDIIRLGDDVGTQNSLLLSLEMWRERLKPRLHRVVNAIREASDGRKIWIQYHSDGEVSPLVDDLIEIGLDILNPVQPECMDLEAIAARFQSRIAFSGMIGTQTTMPFGTPDDVRAAIARCRNLHEGGARVIVSPTHVLEPDVSMENIRAFIEAVKTDL